MMNTFTLREAVETAVLEAITGFDLRAFAKLPTLKDQHAYAAKFLGANAKRGTPHVFMGEGSAREVYRLSSSKVLKLARDVRHGIPQNQEEARIGTDPSYAGVVAQVFQHDPEGRWLISELVRPFPEGDPSELQQMLGFPFNLFERFVRGFSANDFVIEPEVVEGWAAQFKTTPDQINKWLDGPTMTGVFALMEKEDLLAGDIVRPEHWGKSAAGRLVMVDYGWTEAAADIRDKGSLP